MTPQPSASQARLRRSMLYMPGANPRALAKGRTLPADGLILDLEDAVAPDAKEEARARIGEALAEGGYGNREVLVRVNGLETPWGHDDLLAAAAFKAHGIVLPKVESADAVRRAEAILISAGAPADLALWCMIETPRGVLRAEEIAEASPRLAGLVLGTSDLAKDLRCAHVPGREPLLGALSMSLLAARAAGVAVLDGVHLDLEDDDGLADACRQGREMGFDGKTLIHPRQIEAANHAFAPGDSEVEQARKVIRAHEQAVAEGRGVVVVDGRLVENLHVEEARRTLALAQAIGALD